MVQVRSRSAERHPASIFFGAERAHASVRIGEIVDIEMGVRFDSSRDHDLAAGVDRSSGLGRMLLGSDENDLFALHADAPLTDALGSNDLTAANQ
jgi:hypothetical protein